jgi:hypothetical protein
MKACIVVILVALVSHAVGQQFSDVVPRNHWAYEAVLRLKDQGLLVGFPDKQFRGARNATRYEVASAIRAAHEYSDKIIGSHETRLKALEDLWSQPTGIMTCTPDSLASDVEALRQELANLRRWQAEMGDLHRLTKEFQRELSVLGVDIVNARRDISDLQKRVQALERGSG